MKFLIIKLVLLFSFINANSTLANENHTVVDGEYFVLHVNKSFFVTGETVWYSLYIPNALKGVSFMAQVQLIAQDGTIKDHYFLKTEGKKQLDGYFKIPFDWSTGYYTLAFSGIDEATKASINLAQTALPIYNDLDKLPADLEVQTLGSTANNEVLGSRGAVDIQLNQRTFSQGAEINANVFVKDGNGKPVAAKISVSVIDYDLGGDHLLGENSVTTFNSTPLPQVTLSNKLYAFGQLTKKDDTPLNANIVGAFSPLENKVHYLKSDVDGKYALKLPEFYGEKPLQVLLYKSYEKFNVLPANKAETTLETKQIVYTEEILEYLKQSRIRKKIYQFYGGVENDLTTNTVKVDRSKLKPGLTYKMAEYESFDNIGEFFIEVTTPLRFKINKDNTFSAAIVNPRQYTSSTKTLSGDPLYIIDGKVTKNADFVGKIKLTDVNEVKLYYNPNKLNKHYRGIALGGVAEISTTVDDFHVPIEDEEDIFIAKGIQTEGNFEAAVDQDGFPVFKPQLYWNPMIATDNKGKAKLRFDQSKDVSTFLIKVVAQTATGEVIYGEQTYQVKRAN